MAAWFLKCHNSNELIQFFIGAAKGRMPLWDPNANPIKSWHKTMEFLPELVMRASFTTFLEVNLPEIAFDASVQLATKNWEFQPAFIPYEMAVVALERLNKGCPVTEMRQENGPMYYKVMSRRYWAKHPKMKEMTQEFITEYKRCYT